MRDGGGMVGGGPRGMRRTVGTWPSYGGNTNYGARNFSNTILLLPALLLI